jgi:fumarate hydratase class II
MSNVRKENDSLGEVDVPADKLWGAPTQRSLAHFSIGADLMPREMIGSYAVLKKAAAIGLVARRLRKTRRRRRGIVYATRTKLACPSLRIRLSDLIAMATSVTRRASSRDFKASPMTRL